MATHSSILAREIPWTEEPVGLSLWVTVLPGSGMCPDQPPEPRAQDSCTLPNPLGWQLPSPSPCNDVSPPTPT